MSPRRESEAGYTLVALMATVTIMLLTMSAGVPYWRYVVKDDREQELLFRGGEIADAIQAYQARHGNAPPPSLEVLVEMRFLRREYRDPMSESGEWRLIRQGEAVGPIQPPGSSAPGGAPGRAPGAPATPTPTPAPRSATAGVTRSQAGPGGAMGGIVGVASTSDEESLRIFNGAERYDQWLFIAGQPRIVGRTPQVPAAGPAGPAGPGGAPTPLPAVRPPGATPTPLQLPLQPRSDGRR